MTKVWRWLRQFAGRFAPVDARDSPEYCDAYNKVLRDVFGDAADEHLISPRTAK